MLHSTIKNIPQASTVFLRIDANVPIQNGCISNDFRLRAIKPTLDLLIEKKSTIILATHIGRPKKYDPNLSTLIITQWLKKHSYNALFAQTLDAAHGFLKTKKEVIIVLENLRFFKGERSQDKHFAHALKALAQYYVNDAFATLHRNDSSVYTLPLLYDTSKKTIGLLVEHEIKYLTTLLNRPRNGFTLILGGGKLETKIPLINHLLEKVDTILLCPAITFTFLKALGKSVGKSLVDDTLLNACTHIIEKAKKCDTSLVYPEDYLVAQDTIENPLQAVEDHIPNNSIGITIGEKTLKSYNQIIQKSTTIFYNGMMGIHHIPPTMENTEKLFSCIARSNAYSVIAGGDSISLVEEKKLAPNISYLSTGGGSTLAFLCRKKLPGLIATSK